MIEVYQISTGKYDPTLPSILHRNINSTTRGNPLKLCTYVQVRFMQIQLYGVIQQFQYSFRNRLDKFWANEEARFDYKANLSGSGFVRCF